MPLILRVILVRVQVAPDMLLHWLVLLLLLVDAPLRGPAALPWECAGMLDGTPDGPLGAFDGARLRGEIAGAIGVVEAALEVVSQD